MMKRYVARYGAPQTVGTGARERFRPAYWVFPLLFLPMVLTCCQGVDLDVYYNSEGLAPETYVPLSKGQRPRVVEVLDLVNEVERYKADGYVQLGSLLYAGMRISQGDIIDYARRKGATLVLRSSRQVGTAEQRYVVPVTDSATVYTTGSVRSNDYIHPSSYNYNATSTITSTDWATRSYNVGVYNTACVFMAKKR